MIEPVIHERLCEAAGYLVGGGGAFDSAFGDAFDDDNPATARVYPVTATQDTDIPFVVYAVKSTDAIWTLAGPLGSAAEYDFVVDCYAVQFADAGAIADSVRAGLNGWKDLGLGVEVCRLTDSFGVPLEQGYGYSLTFHLITKDPE